jgi:uncharacterized protein (UPF0261 family)
MLSQTLTVSRLHKGEGAYRMSGLIAVIGTLDTKGDQIQYLAKKIEDLGYAIAVIDVGVLGKVPFRPTVTRERVAEAAGCRLADVIALNDSCLASSVMAKGAGEFIKGWCEKEEIAGIIALGGSQGTGLALTVMKSAPIGIPKVLVTTVAYSPLITPEMVSGDDIIMIPWTAGLWGLNSISRLVIEVAAGVVTGAAGAYRRRKPSVKRLVGVTSLGGAISRYLKYLKPALEKRGYEAAVFHVTGMSGRIFERAVRDGWIAASLDLAAAIELLNCVTDGACSAGKNRLEAAGEKGIPQIVSPGPIEAFHWGKDRPLPKRYQDRPHHQHSALILTVRSSVEEITATAQLMAQKLNAAKGPVAVVLPMKGMISGNPTGPRPTPASLTGVEKFRLDLMSITLPGMQAFRDGLIKNIRPGIEVVTLDASFNDPLYAETVLRLFDAMVSSPP